MNLKQNIKYEIREKNQQLQRMQHAIRSKRSKEGTWQRKLSLSIGLVFGSMLHKTRNKRREQMINEFNDRRFIHELLQLRAKDPEKFLDVVYQAIVKNPTAALESEADRSKKEVAITKMIRHYEAKEMYERCAVLKDLLKKINSAWQKKTSSL